MDPHPAQEPLDPSSPVHHFDDDEVESICSELEHVELTEEQTASLLNDALALNRRLKEELRRQEQEDRDKRNGNKQGSPGGGTGRRGNASTSASLPPINPKKGLSVNQRRIFHSAEAGSPGRGGHQKTRKNVKPGGANYSMQRMTHSADGHVDQRPSSSTGQPRKRGTQSAESKQRPEWNDRFSF